MIEWLFNRLIVATIQGFIFHLITIYLKQLITVLGKS